jgi:hypothetical protein
MAFKLLLAAEKRWRRINAPHLVALVQVGVRLSDGQWQVPALDAQNNGYPDTSWIPLICHPQLSTISLADTFLWFTL